MLAWYREEPAAPKVAYLLDQAAKGDLSIFMSWINVGEVYSMLVRKKIIRPPSSFRHRCQLFRLP